ncbi:unnamed protein product [Heterobilharzia americana]|nr:unnamed protein product [Heterobilharzia americana]
MIVYKNDRIAKNHNTLIHNRQTMRFQLNMFLLLTALITMFNFVESAVLTAGSNTSQSPGSLWDWVKWLLTILCTITNIVTTYFG